MWHFGHYWHFEIIENANNANNVILRNYEWSIDFQGERMLKWISADFLRMSENVFAGSP